MSVECHRFGVTRTTRQWRSLRNSRRSTSCSSRPRCRPATTGRRARRCPTTCAGISIATAVRHVAQDDRVTEPTPSTRGFCYASCSTCGPCPAASSGGPSGLPAGGRAARASSFSHRRSLRDRATHRLRGRANRRRDRYPRRIALRSPPRCSRLWAVTTPTRNPRSWELRIVSCNGPRAVAASACIVSRAARCSSWNPSCARRCTSASWPTSVATSRTPTSARRRNTERVAGDGRATSSCAICTCRRSAAKPYASAISHKYCSIRTSHRSVRTRANMREG